MAANPVIQTDNLTKVYQSRKDAVYALKNLNLNVEQGEIFGYLGPNGAGKTTTIRLLLDLIRPTKGRASIFGLDANASSVALHQRIGFLPGELNLWKHLTGRQVVNYVANVRGDDGRIVKYAQELGEMLDLDFTKKVRAYSSGNRRKLGLVVSMMHKPDLLILDEPTGGLDPLLQQTFNQMMRDVRSEGRTVFLSSHVLGEVQAICDRVGILRNGELKAVERVDSLTETKFHWVTLTFREPVAPQMVAQVPGVSDVTVEENALNLRLSGDFDPLLRAVDGHYIVSVHTKEPTLEEIFLAFYGNNGGKCHERRDLFNTLKSHWRGALYWGIGLALLGFYILAVIPDSEVLNQFTQLAESLPPVLFQMFGGIDAASLGTPEGFISFGFFGYVLILLAFYAVMTGLNVTANEEDDGILDMVLSLPLPRWRVMLERFAAHALLTTGMVLISLLGLWLGGQRSVLELNMGRLAEATLNVLPGVFFMMALTIFAAVIVRRKAVAVGIVVTVIVVSYFLDFLGKSITNDIVQAVQKLSFFTYYDTADVMQNGLNIGNVSLLLGLTVVLVAGALWAFNRRDVGL